MRKYTFLILTILCSIPSFSYGQKYILYQTQNIHNHLKLNTATGRVNQVQDDGNTWIVVTDLEPGSSTPNRFRLYETKNMWTFIELDTFTGRLWQIQYSVEGTDKMGSVPINLTTLSHTTSRSVFSAFPMTSMYQFYLLNEETGQMWKFQWSTKGDDYRWIEKY